LVDGATVAVRASAVAAPVGLVLGALAHYCNAANDQLVVCRAGERTVMPQPQRLVTISVVARLGAGDHDWYAWSFTAPAGCRGTAKASVVYVTTAPGSDSERFAQVGRSTAIVP
jgi:hypothetical protein